MEYLVWLVVGLVTAGGGVLLHMIASELYAQAPSLAARLIGVAAQRLAPHQRNRYREEWLAHLDECEGNLTRVLHAVECVLAARALRRLGAAQKYVFRFSDSENAEAERIVKVSPETMLVFLNKIEQLAKDTNDSSFAELWSGLKNLRNDLAHEIRPNIRPNRDELRQLGEAFSYMADSIHRAGITPPERQ